MKEIEVKAKLKDKGSIVEKLKNLGCVFEEPITQNDTVYVKNVGSKEIYDTNDVFLRIRAKNKNKFFFTLKKPVKNDLDVFEYETEILTPKEMENALLEMGYKIALRINKTRVITHYNDCEICIDEVEGLGSFIEMEKLTENEDSEEVQKELFNFFISIGINQEDRVLNGYDTLMLQKLEQK